MVELKLHQYKAMVLVELTELSKLITVSTKAFDNITKLTESDMNMTITEAADMCIDLS